MSQKKRATSPWTDEVIEKLKALNAERVRIGDIAAELGLNKNQVIGRMFRMGLLAKKGARGPNRNPRVSKPKPPLEQPYEQRVHSIDFRINRPAHLVQNKQPQKPTFDGEVFECRLVTITDLGPGMCKWPIGDPMQEDFRFCGNDTARECYTPYCKPHAERSYEPLRSRR